MLKETFQNYCSFSTVLLDHPAAHSSGHSCCICLLLLYTGVPVIPLVWEFFSHIHSTYAFAILPQKYDYVNQVASAHRTGTDAVSPLHLLTTSCVVGAPGLWGWKVNKQRGLSVSFRYLFLFFNSASETYRSIQNPVFYNSRYVFSLPQCAQHVAKTVTWSF